MAKQTFTVGQVLTAAQLISLQQTAMGGGAASAKTASYTLVAADAGTTISMTSTSATTITVNTGLFAAGDTVFIQNLGSGNCTVTAGTATVSTAGSAILPTNDAGILYFVSTGVAIFYDFIQTGAVSPLTTKGDLYGFSTLDARIPIGANNTVLTADSTETLGLKWAAPAGSTLPAFSAYGNSVNQTLVANVNTKITFNTEEYDTDGCFASNRFTPTKAGYYVISAYVDADSPSSTITRLYLWKNGAAWKYLRSEYGHTGEREMNGTAQVYLNGTTDYVEIYAVSGQATGIYKNQEYGYFQGVGATS
jgi:hypothetical protein